MSDNARAIVGFLGIGALFVWGVKARAQIGQFDTFEDLQGAVSGMIDHGRLSTLAHAIGLAEGDNVVGAVPYRAHNPGDLKLGDVGLGTINGITIFHSDAEGEAALEKQLDKAADGSSRYYHLDMTIADMARRWTANDADTWAANVARFLGVTPDTTLREVLE